MITLNLNYKFGDLLRVDHPNLDDDIIKLGFNPDKFIYGIHNFELDKWYIGSSLTTPQNRFYGFISGHIYEINSGTHNFITLDNYNEFELIIFGIGEDFDDVRLLESNLCRQYKSYLTEGGYNRNLSGGLGVGPGYRWIYNLSNPSQVTMISPIDELPEGWEFGRGDFNDLLGTRLIYEINNPSNLRRIKECEELPEGFNFGNSALKGRIWIHKEIDGKNVTRRITDISELPEGWSVGLNELRGDNTGTVWVNDGINEFMVDPDNIPKGCVEGRLTSPNLNRVYAVNEHEHRKMIKMQDVVKYHKLGYAKGRRWASAVEFDRHPDTKHLFNKLD